ncbi:MAG TPA: DUF1850 domain-containing protein [Thermodesulfobacteriota bacterium]|nr:DUF1850 domain-containing protein [Thermodesulfobacteriota bacterium]
MKKTLYSLIALIAGFFLTGSLISRWTLEVREKKSGEVFLRERVIPGEVFHFRYTHSVEKTPVEAIFEIEKNGFLRMVQMRFSSHGPGLPIAAERSALEGGWFTAKGRDSLEKVTFLFISLNQPLLRFRDREFRLSPKGREEGSLEISVRRDSLLLHFLKTRVRLP